MYGKITMINIKKIYFNEEYLLNFKNFVEL